MTRNLTFLSSNNLTNSIQSACIDIDSFQPEHGDSIRCDGPQSLVRRERQRVGVIEIVIVVRELADPYGNAVFIAHFSHGHRSRPLQKAINDFLGAGMLEIDSEFLAFDEQNAAIAEFVVEDARTDSELHVAGA